MACRPLCPPWSLAEVPWKPWPLTTRERGGESAGRHPSLWVGRRRLCFDPFQGSTYIPLVHPEARDVEASMSSLDYQIVYNSSLEARLTGPCISAPPRSASRSPVMKPTSQPLAPICFRPPAWVRMASLDATVGSEPGVLGSVTSEGFLSRSRHSLTQARWWA